MRPQYHCIYGRLQAGDVVIGDPLVAIGAPGLWNGKDMGGFVDLYFDAPKDSPNLKGGDKLPHRARFATWELLQPKRKVAQDLLACGYCFDVSQLRHVLAYIWESAYRCARPSGTGAAHE